MAAKSSWIESFEYDPASLRLTTHLKSGAIYQHTFVNPLEWLALQTSQSHSKHWADNIRGKKLSVKVKTVKSPDSPKAKLVPPPKLNY